MVKALIVNRSRYEHRILSKVPVNYLKALDEWLQNIIICSQCQFTTYFLSEIVQKVTYRSVSRCRPWILISQIILNDVKLQIFEIIIDAKIG